MDGEDGRRLKMEERVSTRRKKKMKNVSAAESMAGSNHTTKTRTRS